MNCSLCNDSGYLHSDCSGLYYPCGCPEGVKVLAEHYDLLGEDTPPEVLNPCWKYGL